MFNSHRTWNVESETSQRETPKKNTKKKSKINNTHTTTTTTTKKQSIKNIFCVTIIYLSLLVSALVSK